MSAIPASFDAMIFQGDKDISQGRSMFCILGASLMKFITFNQQQQQNCAKCFL